MNYEKLQLEQLTRIANALEQLTDAVIAIGLSQTGAIYGSQASVQLRGIQWAAEQSRTPVATKQTEPTPEPDPSDPCWQKTPHTGQFCGRRRDDARHWEKETAISLGVVSPHDFVEEPIILGDEPHNIAPFPKAPMP